MKKDTKFENVYFTNFQRLQYNKKVKDDSSDELLYTLLLPLVIAIMFLFLNLDFMAIDAIKELKGVK